MHRGPREQEDRPSGSQDPAGQGLRVGAPAALPGTAGAQGAPRARVRVRLAALTRHSPAAGHPWALTPRQVDSCHCCALCHLLLRCGSDLIHAPTDRSLGGVHLRPRQKRRNCGFRKRRMMAWNWGGGGHSLRGGQRGPGVWGALSRQPAAVFARQGGLPTAQPTARSLSPFSLTLGTGEGGREARMCERNINRSRLARTQCLDPKPRRVPRPAIKPTSLWSSGDVQPTEPPAGFPACSRRAHTRVITHNPKA